MKEREFIFSATFSLRSPSSDLKVPIVSSNAVKVFGVDVQPCSTGVYTFNSSAALPVIGKFSALIKCVDMGKANKATSREQHLLPTLDEVLHDLNGATVFSKLDLNQGYHQLMLHPDPRHITTFSVHIGLFRYKRLSFGINAASEKFQNVVASAISDIPNVKNISEDVVISGVNVQEHEKALHAVLTRSQELNLTLRKNKFQFYMPRIEFFGMAFSAQGMSLTLLRLKQLNKPSCQPL